MKEDFRKLIDEIKARWDEAKKAKQGWFKDLVSRFSLAVPFLMKAIDELMRFVEGKIKEGLAKKVLVMEAASELFDYIILPILPFWARPFGPIIKNIVVNVVISNFIDFLVDKLNSLNVVQLGIKLK